VCKRERKRWRETEKEGGDRETKTENLKPFLSATVVNHTLTGVN
jgi:hypothetical protein